MSEKKTRWRGFWGASDQQSSENSGAHEHERIPPQNVHGPLPGQNFDSEKNTPSHAADHFQNILGSSGVALLVVDLNFQVCFYTPAAMTLFKITQSDLGRPLAEIALRFADDDLLLDADTVIATGTSLRRDVATDDGACFDRRLLPYRTDAGEVQGVVMTFTDVSEKKEVERELETTRAYSNSVIDTLRQSLVVLDEELRVISATPSFYRRFAVWPAEAVGKLLPQLRDRCLDVRALQTFLDQIARGDEVAKDYEIEIELPPHGRRILLLNARNICLAPPATQRTLLAIDDITDRKYA